MVGRYVIMPDHVHLFAAPNDEVTQLESWCAFWKRQSAKAMGSESCRYWEGRRPRRPKCMRRGEREDF